MRPVPVFTFDRCPPLPKLLRSQKKKKCAPNQHMQREREHLLRGPEGIKP